MRERRERLTETVEIRLTPSEKAWYEELRAELGYASLSEMIRQAMRRLRETSTTQRDEN